MTDPERQEHFESFYQEIFAEAAKIGKVEEIVVCENNNDHLTGNVYIRFKFEEDAQKARDLFNQRWYDERPVYCELSPVTDFTEACCRQHETKDCTRGGYCNFIHAKRPPERLLRDLEIAQKKYILDKTGKLDPDSESESDSSDSSDRYRRHR